MNIKNIKSEFPIFKQKINGKPLVYLDSANSSQKPKVVIDEISRAMESLNGGMSGITSLNNVDNVMSNMSTGIENIIGTLGDIDPASLSKLEKLSDAMSEMSMSASGIDVAFDGIKSLASQEFVDGLSRATGAIYDFAHALLALNNVEDVDAS